MRRRRVLLVAWHLPPSVAIGARRVAQLARWLPTFGWDVTLVGPHAKPGEPEPTGDVIVTPRLLLSEWVRRLLPVNERPLFEQLAAAPSQQPAGGDPTLRARAFRELRSTLLMPDEQAPWIAAGLASVRRRLRPGDVDIVIGTTPPFSAAVLAAQCARALRAPYVIDFRDPFTHNAVWPPGVIDGPIRRALETRILDRAAHVVTVSEGFVKKQQTMTSTAVSCLPNAWDEDDLSPSTATAPGDAPLLVHAGTLYPDAMRFEPFLEGLRLARERGLKPRVLACGKNTHELGRRMHAAGVGDAFDDRGLVSREEAARLRGSANGLIVFFPSRPEDDGHIPAKLFESIASRKPVLAIGDRSAEPARMLLAYRGIATCEDGEQVAAWLQSAPSEALADEGREQELNARSLAERYAHLLDDLVSWRQGP